MDNQQLTDHEYKALSRFAATYFKIKARIDLEREMLLHYFGDTEWTPQRAIRIAMWKRHYLRRQEVA